VREGDTLVCPSSIVSALVRSVAVSSLLWLLVVILVLFAVLGRGRYYARG
jgi:hypothetical protein